MGNKTNLQSVISCEARNPKHTISIV